MARDPFADVPEPDFDGIGRRRTKGLEGLAAFEDSAVRRLCTLLGLPALARRVADEAADRTELGGCNFALFDEVAYFPVALRVGKLRRVRFVTVPDFFNNFARTPVGVGLQQAYDEIDDHDRPFGLVFHWAGIRTDDGKQNTIKGGKFMIAHTATTEIARAGVKLVAQMGVGRKHRAVVTVETLGAFAENYKEWTPIGG
jgi:hypothetical protein